MKWFGKYKNVEWSLIYVALSFVCIGMFPEALDRGKLLVATLFLMSAIGSMCFAVFLFHFSNTKSGQ